MADEFADALKAEADRAPLDEALAGLHRIATAAGIFEQTWQAASIGEVCDMIAAWCRGRPTDGMIASLKGTIGGLEAELEAVKRLAERASALMLAEKNAEIGRLRERVEELEQDIGEAAGG